MKYWIKSGLTVNRPIEFLKLKLHEHYSSDIINKLQLDKAKRIIRSAYENVPYYRDLFKSIGLCPSGIKTLEDLRRIPILTKDTIRERCGDFISSAHPGGKESIKYVSTTGSTGKPLRIALSEEEMARGYLFLRYGNLKSGALPFTRCVNIYAMNDKVRGPAPRRSDIFQKYDVDLRKGPEANITEINKIRPDYIDSYPSYLALLANFMIENDINLPASPKMVFTNGEVLTTRVRDLIKKAFKCPVRNTYGSAEFFRIAFECAHGSLHIIPDSVIVEIEDGAAGNPIEGEAIITSLYHYTMPLIRYKIGDRISLSVEKCACGSNFTIIKDIIGRSDDYITLPSGRTISARAINLLDDVPGVAEYQITQKNRDLFEVLVRVNNSFSNESAEAIKNIISHGCRGEDVRINIIKVDKLNRPLAGKLRAVISETG